MQFQNRWTAEQRAAIVREFASNSATDLALKYHCSRHAIIGLVHRERLKAGHKPNARRPVQVKPNPTRQPGARRATRVSPVGAPIAAKPMRQEPALPPDVLRLPLGDLKAGQCRFPVTPHDAAPHEHLFCGAQTDAAYCGWHDRIAHQPA